MFEAGNDNEWFRESETTFRNRKRVPFTAFSHPQSERCSAPPAASGPHPKYRAPMMLGPTQFSTLEPRNRGTRHDRRWFLFSKIQRHGGTDVYSRSAVRLNRCSRECLGQTSAAAAVRPRATFPACSCSGRTTPPFKPLAAPNRRDRPEPSELFLMICCPPGVGLSKKTTPLSPDPAHHTDECTRPRGTQPRGAATTVVLRWRSESVDQECVQGAEN